MNWIIQNVAVVAIVNSKSCPLSVLHVQREDNLVSFAV